MGFGVAGDFARHEGSGSRVGIAQAGIERNAFIQAAHAVYLRHMPPLLRRGLHAVVLPMQPGNPQRLARPAMAHGMIEKPAPLDSAYRRALHLARQLRREAFACAKRIILVRIPPFKERIRLPELCEIGVISGLGRVVDDVQHVFKAYASLDADSPVAVGRAYGQACSKAVQAAYGNHLALRAGAQKSAAGLAQQVVHAQQGAALVCVIDAARAAGHIDSVCIVPEGIGHMKAFHLAGLHGREANAFGVVSRVHAAGIAAPLAAGKGKNRYRVIHGDNLTICPRASVRRFGRSGRCRPSPKTPAWPNRAYNRM